MNEFIEIGKQFGIAGVVLLAIWYTGQRFSSWAGPRIDKLIDLHTDFVNDTKALQEKIAASMLDVHTDVKAIRIDVTRLLDGKGS